MSAWNIRLDLASWCMDRTHIWECHANLPMRDQFRRSWDLSDIPNHMQRNACRLQQLWADQDQFLLEDHRWDCKHIAVDDTGLRLHKSASDMIVEGLSSCLRAQLTWNFLTPTPTWVTTWIDIWCLLKVLEFASWLGLMYHSSMKCYGIAGVSRDSPSNPIHFDWHYWKLELR